MFPPPSYPTCLLGIHFLEVKFNNSLLASKRVLWGVIRAGFWRGFARFLVYLRVSCKSFLESCLWWVGIIKVAETNNLILKKSRSDQRFFLPTGDPKKLRHLVFKKKVLFPTFNTNLLVYIIGTDFACPKVKKTKKKVQ